MNDFEKIVIILIRLQALSFILMAMVYWGIIAVAIIIASLDPKRVANYETLLITSIFSLVVGLILYARSKSLANYFIAGLQKDEQSSSQD